MIKTKNKLHVRQINKCQRSITVNKTEVFFKPLNMCSPKKSTLEMLELSVLPTIADRI